MDKAFIYKVSRKVAEDIRQKSGVEIHPDTIKAITRDALRLHRELWKEEPKIAKNMIVTEIVRTIRVYLKERERNDEATLDD